MPAFTDAVVVAVAAGGEVVVVRVEEAAAAPALREAEDRDRLAVEEGECRGRPEVAVHHDLPVGVGEYRVLREAVAEHDLLAAIGLRAEEEAHARPRCLQVVLIARVVEAAAECRPRLRSVPREAATAQISAAAPANYPRSVAAETFSVPVATARVPERGTARRSYPLVQAGRTGLAEQIVREVPIAQAQELAIGLLNSLLGPEPAPAPPTVPGPNPASVRAPRTWEISSASPGVRWLG